MQAGSARRPTIKDVARQAGVSPMTASRVVGGVAGVSPDRVKAVKAAVKELGYKRNEAARLMRPGQRSGLLGVIVTNIDNPYYAQVLLGVEEAAKRAGRLIIAGISHNDSALEADLVRSLVARQVEGLVVVPASTEAPHLNEAAGRGLPIVLASRSIEAGRVDTVLVDDVGAVRVAVRELLETGRVPVGFIGGPDTITTAARRFIGFQQAHLELGIDIRPHLVARIPADPDAVTAATLRMLDAPEPPAAWFATNNRYSVGVLRVLLQQRARWEASSPPPLVGFDTFELADLVDYPMSLIGHDANVLGRIAAEQVLRRIEQGDRLPPMSVTLPSTGTVLGGRPLG